MSTSLKMGVKFDNSERKLRVAVVGGGPSGSCAAEILAQVQINVSNIRQPSFPLICLLCTLQEPNIETYIFERKMDNAKPCGGAIPICMVDEFQIPSEIIDRKVRKMLMISPTGKEVPIGSTLKPEEYIGMTRYDAVPDTLCQLVSFRAMAICLPEHYVCLVM
jgi:geranylgeranyl diphosphate/geranylgeranyl-bacteriochlorophyllide a reductase